MIKPKFYKGDTVMYDGGRYDIGAVSPAPGGFYYELLGKEDAGWLAENEIKKATIK